MSERLVTLVGMRPALKPGLLPVWRNRDTVQVGIDPRRAVALTGMRGAAALLGLLDGSRDRAQVLAAADDLGIPSAAADRVISLLAAGGALHDFPASTYQMLPQELRARLAPELATAALAHGDADGGARILARRQGACVRVHGVGRVGLSVASLLTAAGIGLVVSAGQVPAEPARGQAPGEPAGGQAPNAPARPAWPASSAAIPLSHPGDLRLPMRWIAMLYGRIGASLAATSGIHRATDALKMLMAGADVTNLCSVLLRRGIEHIRVIEREMREWMEEHEYESVEQLKGSMSQKNCPDPSAFERAQYMRALETYPAEDV